MAHFAKVEDGLVTQVIVAEQWYIDAHAEGTWVQTSYNTWGNVHLGPDKSPDGGTPLNKNFAGKGFHYVDGKGFHAPSPYPSWTLNQDSFLWEPPSARPDDFADKRYVWNEETQSWVEIEFGD